MELDSRGESPRRRHIWKASTLLPLAGKGGSCLFHKHTECVLKSRGMETIATEGIGL